MLPELALMILVKSSQFGLHPTADVLISARQRDGQFIASIGFLVSSQWCNHALQECIDDQGTGCPADECTHVWAVYSCCEGIWIEATPGLPVTFWATNPDGAIQEGAWAGPADWNLDGVVNSSDFFAFINDFFRGDADYNLDLQTGSPDYLLFLEDFFAT